jgi:1,4-dihydroxy-2-naphthoate octaprenyltransferase
MATEETVKNLSWQLLYGNWRLELGPEHWDEMVEDVGGPDVQETDSLADVPMEPFNEACLVLDEEVGDGDGSEIAEIARASVRAWANMNGTTVDSLQGDAEGMLRTFCTEVHPFFLDDADASELVEVGDGEATVRLDNGLLEPFKVGLLEGFVELVGAEAHVDASAEGLQVRWTFGEEPPEPSTLAVLMEAVRAPFLTATLAPILVGTALAWRAGPLDWTAAVLALVGAACFHLGTNTLNDYFDQDADAANPTPTPFTGGSRVIQRGLVSPRTMLGLSLLLFGVGVGIGILLATWVGWGLLWLGLAGFLLGVAYTAPPLKLAHRGLGELATAAGFGPIMVLGAYHVQTGSYAAAPAAASIPLAALIAAVLYVNEFPDVEGDAKVGKDTLVVRLGVERAVTGYGLLLVLAYAGIVGAVVAGILPTLSLVALLAAPLSWKAWTTVRDHYADPYQLVPASLYTVLAHAATGLLLTVGIVAGGFV